MDYSALANEMIRKMGELMKTSFWPRKASTFLHGEMFILNHMLHREDTVIPSDLAAAMHTSSARVAMALKSLEAKGFITRRIDSADRRKINVTLTPHGKELVVEHKMDMQRKIELILSQLGEEDAREYIRIVGRMADIARTIKTEPRNGASE